MKQRFILIVLVLSIFTSCSNDDDNDSPSCIAPPTGTIETGKKNLAVFFEEGLESFVSIKIMDANNEEYDLDTSSFGQEPFSQWQTIPDLDYSKVILDIANDILYEYENINFPEDNELLLVINRSNDDGYEVSIEKYQPCNDTPND